jgi:hypothetical protein
VSLFAVAAQPDAEGLLGRVNALEKRVAELEKRQATTVMLPAGQAPKQIPPGWSPQTINGMTYYIVPLDHNSDQKAKPAH